MSSNQSLVAPMKTLTVLPPGYTLEDERRHVQISSIESAAVDPTASLYTQFSRANINRPIYIEAISYCATLELETKRTVAASGRTKSFFIVRLLKGAANSWSNIPNAFNPEGNPIYLDVMQTPEGELGPAIRAAAGGTSFTLNGGNPFDFSKFQESGVLAQALLGFFHSDTTTTLPIDRAIGTNEIGVVANKGDMIATYQDLGDIVHTGTPLYSIESQVTLRYRRLKRIGTGAGPLVDTP